MLTRRQLIKRGAAGTAGVMFGGVLLETSALGAASVASSLTPYLDPMPLLVDNAIDATGGAPVNLSTGLISRKVHSQLSPTTFFGYLRSGGPGPSATGASYLGPAIVAKSGVPVTATYSNGLAAGAYTSVFTNAGSSYLQFPPAPEVRILTHLHGGFVAGNDDGNPYAQPDAFGNTSPLGSVQSVTYPMEQPATLLWYHDHYMGDTRMNVVAGLAGGFLVRDGFDSGSNPLFPGPIGRYELPLVVQDKQFNANGSLLYPIAPSTTNGPWIGEYFGDVMLVNGKIWPTLSVEPAVYRFRVLNGCNARILNLKIVAGNTPVPTYVIGTEGGLLPINPVTAKSLIMTPAERYDVIVDFRGFAGKTLLITNTNPPAPVSTPAPSLTQVMQIKVAATASSGAPSTIPPAGSLPDNPSITALTNLGAPLLSGGTVAGRMITLNEVGAGTSSWKLNMNAQPYGSSSPVVEKLARDGIEDWYFVNMTPDTHPMHTHLFTFRVMGRYNFDAAGYAKANAGPNGVPQKDVSSLTPFLKSGLMAPDPTEVGFKETVKANPGQVAVVHEDNDMMERFEVS